MNFTNERGILVLFRTSQSHTYVHMYIQIICIEQLIDLYRHQYLNMFLPRYETRQEMF